MAKITAGLQPAALPRFLFALSHHTGALLFASLSEFPEIRNDLSTFSEPLVHLLAGKIKESKCIALISQLIQDKYRENGSLVQILLYLSVILTGYWYDFNFILFRRRRLQACRRPGE